MIQVKMQVRGIMRVTHMNSLGVFPHMNFSGIPREKAGSGTLYEVLVSWIAFQVTE